MPNKCLYIYIYIQIESNEQNRCTEQDIHAFKQTNYIKSLMHGEQMCGTRYLCI